MLSADLRPGTEYGFREKRMAGAPLHRIRLIEHIRRDKWKAKWIDPNPGLTDYVTTAQVIVSWSEHKAFLRDEANREKLFDHVDKCGFKVDSPLENALHCVFENMGEAAFRYDRGELRGRLEQLERVKDRAKCKEDLMRAPAYIDREGFVHVPLDAALTLARKFCAEEPAAVLADIEATERKWSLQATTSDGDHIVPLLNSYRAAWVLLRQWCGMDAAIASRQNRIAALEKMVWDAVYALQKAGLDHESDKLRRKLTS